MGSGQSKALVIGKRGRQVGACVFLCTLYDGATAELCGGTRSGRENKWPLSILTHFAILLKTPSSWFWGVGWGWGFWDCWCLLVSVICV